MGIVQEIHTQLEQHMAASMVNSQDPQLHRIRGDSYRFFITGRGSDKSQYLIVLQMPKSVIIRFDRNGVFLDSCIRELQTACSSAVDSLAAQKAFATRTDAKLCRFLASIDFVDDVIIVQRFYLNDYDIGILGFPRGFSEILAAPSEYSDEELGIAQAEMDRWKKNGLCELWLNSESNLWITSAGDIESS